MARVGRQVRDKRLLALMGKYLRAGVLVGETLQATALGTPQGGPLSPPTMLHKRVISRRERTLIDAKYHVNALGVNLDAFDPALTHELA